MKTIVKWLAIPLGGLVVAAAMLATNGFAQRDGQASAPGTQASAPTPVAVSVQALSQAYETNEVLADERYRDKWLALSGEINGITKDTSDNIIVKLKGAKAILEIHATLKSGTLPPQRSLGKGEQITLLCKGENFLWVRFPKLSGCEILR